MREAVLYAVNKALLPCIFETDSKDLVSSVAFGRNYSLFGPIIDDINLIIHGANGSVIRFVKGVTNRHAVRLATLALNCSYDIDWVGNPPS